MIPSDGISSLVIRMQPLGKYAHVSRLDPFPSKKSEKRLQVPGKQIPVPQAISASLRTSSHSNAHLYVHHHGQSDEASRGRKRSRSGILSEKTLQYEGTESTQVRQLLRSHSGSGVVRSSSIMSSRLAL
jgi:hypothetical protein